MRLLLLLLTVATPMESYASQCLDMLLSMSGSGRRLDAQRIEREVTRVNRDREFRHYMYALIYVESRFNRLATSSKGAVGLSQLTPGAVEDAARYCKMGAITTTLYNVSTNVRLGACYLDKLVRDNGGDYTRALIIYNGGYNSLTRWDRYESIPGETANYVLRVHRVQQLCRSLPTQQGRPTK